MRHILWLTVLGLMVGQLKPQMLLAAENQTAQNLTWVARRDLPADEEQKLCDNLTKQRYVPIYSKGTVVDGKLTYDVVYLRPLDVAWQYRLYNDAEFTRRNNELQAQGYKLVNHQILMINNERTHNVIWKKGNGVNWITRRDLPADAEQKLCDTLTAQDYVPIYSRGRFADGKLTYDVIYLKPLDVTWEYRLYTDDEFKRKNRELQAQGYKLVDDQALFLDKTLHHNSIWHK